MTNRNRTNETARPESQELAAYLRFVFLFLLFIAGCSQKAGDEKMVSTDEACSIEAFCRAAEQIPYPERYIPLTIPLSGRYIDRNEQSDYLRGQFRGWQNFGIQEIQTFPTDPEQRQQVLTRIAAFVDQLPEATRGRFGIVLDAAGVSTELERQTNHFIVINSQQRGEFRMGEMLPFERVGSSVLSVDEANLVPEALIGVIFTQGDIEVILPMPVTLLEAQPKIKLRDLQQVASRTQTETGWGSTLTVEFVDLSSPDGQRRYQAMESGQIVIATADLGENTALVWFIQPANE